MTEGTGSLREKNHGGMFANLKERHHGEMLDRNCLPNNFEFSDEELFPNMCESRIDVKCCQSRYVPIDEVIDQSVDIEASLDLKIIKEHKKRAKKMRRVEEKIERKEMKKTRVAKQQKEKIEKEANLSFFEELFNEMFEDDSCLQLSMAYPYKEGMKARYRK